MGGKRSRLAKVPIGKGTIVYCRTRDNSIRTEILTISPYNHGQQPAAAPHDPGAVAAGDRHATPIGVLLLIFKRNKGGTEWKQP